MRLTAHARLWCTLRMGRKASLPAPINAPVVRRLDRATPGAHALGPRETASLNFDAIMIDTPAGKVPLVQLVGERATVAFDEALMIGVHEPALQARPQAEELRAARAVLMQRIEELEGLPAELARVCPRWAHTGALVPVMCARHAVAPLREAVARMDAEIAALAAVAGASADRVLVGLPLLVIEASLHLAMQERARRWPECPVPAVEDIGALVNAEGARVLSITRKASKEVRSRMRARLADEPGMLPAYFARHAWVKAALLPVAPHFGSWDVWAPGMPRPVAKSDLRTR